MLLVYAPIAGIAGHAGLDLKKKKFALRSPQIDFMFHECSESRIWQIQKKINKNHVIF